ncbi:hypothetical protein HDU85_004462 [Gaertneriomyces sp. JEL0708]|nr:hypothetical protein HDU85_004462 [Gaertneriomyces sp. JEL0708]
MQSNDATNNSDFQRHNHIKFIPEIHENAELLLGSAIRVIGTLQAFEPGKSQAVIIHHKTQLLVDVSLLGPFSYRLKTLLEFFGQLEINRTTDLKQIILRARIARNMDGLDIGLFEKAVKIRRRLMK